MKTKVAFLLSLVLLCPVAASTQNAPPNHPDFAAMRATMQQIDNLHKSERTHILASLSSTHRAYLASVIGQLAISTNPNPRAAAAQLDAKLSPSEKQAILNAEKSYRGQMMAIHQQIRAKMEAMLPAGSPVCGNPPSATGGHEWANHPRHAPDAGQILLGVAAVGHAHGMFMMMGGPGMHHGMHGCVQAPSPAG